MSFGPTGRRQSGAVAICLLGGFSVFKHGQPVPMRSGGKLETLLGLLAIRGMGVPRDALQQTLWPEREPELAAQSLNSLVHLSRKVLDAGLAGMEVIVRDGATYRLNLAAGVSVDACLFSALADRAADAAGAGHTDAAVGYLAEAVELYRGDLCLDADVGALVERERLRAQYLNALARLADYEYKRGDVGACLRMALRMLASDPCREDAHRLVMRCHMQRGERIQALRQYQLCERLLRAELDTAPEPATTALFNLARLGRGPLPAVLASSLPPAAHHEEFVTAELQLMTETGGSHDFRP